MLPERVGLNASAIRLADPDSVPDTLPVTKQMHAAIADDSDGLNPQTRTQRALFDAIANLEAAINRGPGDH